MTIIYSEKRDLCKNYVSSSLFSAGNTAVDTAQLLTILNVPECSKGQNLLRLDFYQTAFPSDNLRKLWCNFAEGSPPQRDQLQLLFSNIETAAYVSHETTKLILGKYGSMEIGTGGELL
jgi:hypothetical protein